LYGLSFGAEIALERSGRILVVIAITFRLQRKASQSMRGRLSGLFAHRVSSILKCILFQFVGIPVRSLELIHGIGTGLELLLCSPLGSIMYRVNNKKKHWPSEEDFAIDEGTTVRTLRPLSFVDSQMYSFQFVGIPVPSLELIHGIDTGLERGLSDELLICSRLRSIL
jgi:hypothetical protein